MADEVVHLKDLLPDPHNAREHNERNIGMIVDSLHEVGAARSIVVDEANVVLAGNGVVEGAAEAGITKVRIVEADGNEIIAVRRSGLTDEQKKKLALYDNRAAELSTWDADVLRALASEGVTTKMFSTDEIGALVGAIASGGGEPGDNVEGADVSVLPSKWMVVIMCESEVHQRDLLERFTAESLSCRAVSS